MSSIFLFLVFCRLATCLRGSKLMESKHQFNQLFHLSTNSQLLQAKVTSLLKNTSVENQNVFLSCSKNSKTSQDLAKCIINLMDNNDPYQTSSNVESRGLFGRLIDWVRETFFEKASIPDTNKYFELKIRRIKRKTEKERNRIISRLKNKLSFENRCLTNLKKLEKIQTFQEKYDLYEEMIKRYNDRRKKIISYFHLLPRQKRSIPNPELDKNVDKNSYIFSPRLFSIMKHQQEKRNKAKESDEILMSPEILSLYENFDNSSLMSIPELIKLLNPDDKRKQRRIMDSLLELTGIGKILDKILRPIDYMSEIMDTVLLPLAKELDKSTKNILRLQRTLSIDQRRYFIERGYTFLNADQLNMIHGKAKKNLKGHKPALRGKYFSRIASSMESDIENYIRSVASGETSHRFKRALPSTGTGFGSVYSGSLPGNFLGLPLSGPVVGVLAPFAFIPQVNSLQLFTMYILSPQAFIPSYFNPAAFYLQLLTPWGFLANFASPQAFTCLCLSPTFFEANLFSSTFFQIELLAPTMMQANLLNPYFIDGLVFSPQIMIADLLSPNFMQPKLWSDQILMATLLSPNIGSPVYYSKIDHIIEIFGPNIASPNIHTKVSNSIFLFSPEILGGHGGENEFETEAEENVIVYPPEEKENYNHNHPNVYHPNLLGK